MSHIDDDLVRELLRNIKPSPEETIIRLRLEIERLRAALKPFAEIGRNLYEANQRSDQSVLIGASARYLRLEPLVGQDFVNAHTAYQQQPK